MNAVVYMHVCMWATCMPGAMERRRHCSPGVGVTMDGYKLPSGC